MSNYFLEGETFFVLNHLDKITKNKKTELNPEKVSNQFSMISAPDYYVYFNPSKETIESINHNKYIICFLDKNVDLRLDYIKKIKQNCEYYLYDPIPTTDTNSLLKIFPKLKDHLISLPSKQISLKYKNQKQNYEWFDLCLISDFYKIDDPSLYSNLFSSHLDIWNLVDNLWNGNKSYITQVSVINDVNFEDYFNRIRETSKDYIEIIQSSSTNFYNHKKLLPTTAITSEYRFEKIKEKLSKVKLNCEIKALELIEGCLKNVRLGTNPKLELINLFFNFKNHVLK